MVQNLQLLETKHHNGNNNKLPQGFPDNLASDPNLDI